MENDENDNMSVYKKWEENERGRENKTKHIYNDSNTDNENHSNGDTDQIMMLTVDDRNISDDHNDN